MNSSSFKMAILFTILLGLASIFLGYALYDFGQKNFLRETEAAIDNEIEHILNILDKSPSPTTIKTHIEQQENSGKNQIYHYQDEQGKKIAGNADLPDEINTIKEGVISFYKDKNGKKVLFAAKVHTFNDETQLLIARNIDDINKSYERLKVFSIFIMIFMLLVILVSFFISTFVVKRINIIANTAQKIIETGDLSQRISIQSSWDDLSNLAQTLNSLLQKVEELMHGIRDVSDNISHDLRTPLTRLRNDLEKLKDGNHTKDNIETITKEADHILETFNALLRITNIEKSARHQKFEPSNLSNIIADVIDLYSAVAEEKKIGITSEITSDIIISGDRNLLFQAVANIIDNAIKFSPEHSTITVNLSDTKTHQILTIADQGCGVEKNETERIFDRFYRGDKSRSKAGTGLGLSLVKAIFDLHKANIEVTNNNPGLKIKIIFPKINKL